ncbi:MULTISPECIES: PepSY domain-containing protein [unclassified Neptuniibacter]|uniref:PepSY domain-containing protein n=1 Tax=unclassified Neptuniibacter TaxID=2630693 RepID=UPI000C3C62D7|nr:MULTISPECIES: PepSY domain-containing protein [unclassified Neptuniibacter]MAY42045.1 nitric oxide synthase [Oceanospirillaceae bacterium]|tara:strand:+ start:20880 stop:23105 length:2226 start_codon:yes stop_codon:yes gene_type:complete
MLRKFHSVLGLIAAALVVVISITGGILALDPFLERTQAKVVGTSSTSVAELTAKLTSRYPGAEQIQRTSSGTVIVYFANADGTGADIINPLTGETIGPYTASPVMVWVKRLHRSYLLDTPGRVATGIGALLMLLITFSGVFMLANRLGSFRQIFRPIKGSFKQQLHCQMGRVIVLGLLLSSVTGLYMSAVSLELLPEPQSIEPSFPESVSGGIPLPTDKLQALKEIPVSELRELVYPYAEDLTDVYTIKTKQGSGFIDQSTGQLLSYQAYGTKQAFYELIFMLHTGEGLWWLGLLLGLCALAVPMMSWTGIQIWWERHKSDTELNNNTAIRMADTVILVGSESNSTWGFAKTLHDSLNKAGYLVHTTAMNNFVNHYPHAKRLFVLTSTYGDGDAPSSANHFMAILEMITHTPNLPVAVLGFGDNQFPHFCQFAKNVDTALRAKGWQVLLPFETINQQSPQEFARWGVELSKVLGTELVLAHSPALPRCNKLVLAERIDYGAEVQAPTTVFRFKEEPREGVVGLFDKVAGRSGLSHFEAGDLVGILPPESNMPRFYSLASASKDGMLEICVRYHLGGVCSSYLHALSIGDSINAFIKPNPSFRPSSSNAPIVLIGAGTGIGPLVGFIRHNTAHHAMHLYWGGRCPESDFLYKAELNSYLEDKRLTKLNAVFSRVSQRAYVQDKITLDGDELRRLIEEGAQILVCGGRRMANSVMAALNEVILPLGIDVQTLREQDRYREDVY